MLSSKGWSGHTQYFKVSVAHSAFLSAGPESGFLLSRRCVTATSLTCQPGWRGCRPGTASTAWRGCSTSRSSAAATPASSASPSWTAGDTSNAPGRWRCCHVCTALVGIARCDVTVFNLSRTCCTTIS